ncbi:hypothetical protein L596_022116 [Steinernema carpocapsae]|nr:hypothetical protein L596_022116 [Steinernema carpocapsae]
MEHPLWPKPRIRIYRDERFYRSGPCLSGPHLICRGYDWMDTFEEFGEYLDERSEVKGHLSSLIDNNPFNLPSFNVQYSLDKKKRWKIPERLKDIQAFQNPDQHWKVTVYETAFNQINSFVLYTTRATRDPEKIAYPVLTARTVDDNGEAVHRTGRVYGGIREFL